MLRFVNSYRLLKATLNTAERIDLENWGYRPALTLLAICVADDEGMHAFLWTIKSKLGRQDDPVFRIDLENLATANDFADLVKREWGSEIDQISDVMADKGRAFLILDNIPHYPIKNVTHSEHFQLEILITALSEYCPQLTIILRSRRVSSDAQLKIVELAALDEADTRTFILSHRHGGEKLAKPEALRIIFKHTDGVPVRLDNALRDLEVVTLDELAISDADASTNLISVDNVPTGLIRAISELSLSPNQNTSRSFDLLKALSIFPYGEQLSKIKRLHGPIPFHPYHARQLLDNALIEANEALEFSGTHPEGKVLVVSRPVRDYVREQMDLDELRNLNVKAARLYFGERWAQGTIKFSNAHNFHAPLAKISDIQNASTVIFRLLKDAIEQNNARKKEVAIEVGAAFATKLYAGSHYRAISEFASEFLHLIPAGEFQEKRDFLSFALGRSLRMLGHNNESLAILEKIKDSPHLQSVRQNVNINLALTAQFLAMNSAAVSYAKAAVQNDKHSHLGLQAESIIVEIEASEESKAHLLLELENNARRRGAHVVANNLAISRASLISVREPAEARGIFLSVIEIAKKEGDDYNFYRAVIQDFELVNRRSDNYTNRDKQYLIEAYHFTHQERIGGLFDRAHNALWDMFEREDDLENLMRLFRKSTFIWKIRGIIDRDDSFLRRLASRVGEMLVFDILTASREAIYYMSRISKAL